MIVSIMKALEKNQAESTWHFSRMAGKGGSKHYGLLVDRIELAQGSPADFSIGMRRGRHLNFQMIRVPTRSS